MIAFALQGENLAFTIALGIFGLIAALELLGALLGASLSDAIDSLLPDLDLDVDIDIDLDADVDVPDASGLSSGAGILDWLCVGRVPVLILFVIFLFTFGAAGLLLQAFLQEMTGWTLPGLLAAVPALAVALPMVHFAGRGIARVMPQEETYAVSDSSFIGQVATVTLGVAEFGNPAQAKLKDRHDRTHYVQVEPDEPGACFETGSQVLLVRRDGAVFKVVAATGALVSEDW